MKNAAPFFSDFFNTDCLVVEGEPHFSITGATKTLYGSIGGASVERLRTQLVKMSTHQNPVTAVDLSEFPGFCPVTIEADGTKTGRVREALAINQDTFKALLKMYRGKGTKAGHYADEMTDKLVGVSMDLILRKEAGLLHEEVAKAVDESILRAKADKAKAFTDSPLKVLELAAWRSFNRDNSLTEVPRPHVGQFGREMAHLLRHVVYSRVQANVLDRVDDKRAENGGTIYQYLSDDVRGAITPLVQLLTMQIQLHGLHNIDIIDREISQFYPRYSQGKKETRRVKKMLAL